MIRDGWRRPGLAILVGVVAQVAVSTVAGADCIGSSDRQNWSPCGGGGGYVAPRYVAPPVYQGPSPAELARQRRIAGGKAANDRGAAAVKRGDWAAAVREFEEAIRLWPEDRNVNGNYWNAKGMLALFSFSSDMAVVNRNNRQAIEDFNQALTFYQSGSAHDAILSHLKMARTMVLTSELSDAEDRRDWESVVRYARERAELDSGFEDEVRFALAGQALAHRDWPAAAEELRQYYRGLLDSVRSVADVTGPPRPEVISAFNTDEDATAALARGDLPTARSDLEEAKKLEAEAETAKAKAKGGKTGVSVFTNSARNDPLINEISHQIAIGGGALAQARAADRLGKAGVAASESAKEVLTAPGGPLENASLSAGVVFDKSVAVPASNGSSSAGAPESANHAPQSEFSEQMAAKLRATPAGQQLLAKEVQLRSDLEQLQTSIAKLRGEPNAASNPDYAKALIAQDQLYGKLNALPKEAEKITRVVLDPSGTSNVPNEPPPVPIQALPSGSK